jgi:hypothetical protein
MPVAAVDGAPVAVGHGQLTVALPPGPHMVEVQGTDTSSPVVVDVEPEASHRLKWFEERSRLLRTFGYPSEPVPSAAGRLLFTYHLMWFIAVVVGIPVWIWAVVGSSDSTFATVSLWAVPALMAAQLLFLPWSRAEKRRVMAARAEELAATFPAHRPHPWDGGDETGPALIGGGRLSAPDMNLGHGAVLLDLYAWRHLWNGTGICEREASLAAMWTPSPGVMIDGIDVPATWGTWWYPVRAGAHRITVVVEGAPAGHTGGTPVRNELEFDVDEHGVAVLDATAHVYVVADPGEPVRFPSPVLHLGAGDVRKYPHLFGDG